MKKTIFLTGATDGIGLATAKQLVSKGHTLLLHGRSESKLKRTSEILAQIDAKAEIEIYQADLSNLAEVVALGSLLKKQHTTLDVLINNAGVFKTPSAYTAQGYDLRFIVNTIAPYLLTQKLLSLLGSKGRVINLSSAAQTSVQLNALRGEFKLSDSAAYAQSKLAMTMWTFHLAEELGDSSPSLMALNPASFLGSKMVKDAYGSQGKDLGIGADILVRAALNDEFSHANGKYFDNDLGDWASPHSDALDPLKNAKLVMAIQEVLSKLGASEV